MLPKSLDEEVARAHCPQLGIKLTTMSTEQAEYLGLPVTGPYKADHYVCHLSRFLVRTNVSVAEVLSAHLASTAYQALFPDYFPSLPVRSLFIRSYTPTRSYPHRLRDPSTAYPFVIHIRLQLPCASISDSVIALVSVGLTVLVDLRVLLIGCACMDWRYWR